MAHVVPSLIQNIQRKTVSRLVHCALLSLTSPFSLRQFSANVAILIQRLIETRQCHCAVDRYLQPFSPILFLAVCC